MNLNRVNERCESRAASCSGGMSGTCGAPGLLCPPAQKQMSFAQPTGNWAAPMQKGTSARCKDMGAAVHMWEEASLCVHPMQQPPSCGICVTQEA